MNSRQKTGLVIFFVGMLLFISQQFPQIYTLIRDYITFPVILMAIGLYIVLVNRNNDRPS